MNADESEAGAHCQASGPLGHVVTVGGHQATIVLADDALLPADTRVTVGKLLGLKAGTNTVVGVITAVGVGNGPGAPITAAVDMLGEIVIRDGKRRFNRGVSEYPAVGDKADLVCGDDLRLMYDISGANTINLGCLSQDPSVGAYVNVDEMLNKHFAVLGTTGVGKSSGVALILQEVLRARPQQRIFLIDPHNEYGQCFGDKAVVLTPANLRLPFWLFNFEETVDVFFRARPGVEEEVEILSEAIGNAKSRFSSDREGQTRVSLRKQSSVADGPTVDTPVPYRLSDLLAQIDERMGKLENRSAFPKYHRLISRIETVSNDPRYRFMFERANVGGDTMADVLAELFCLAPDGPTVTVMQLAGFPSEVVDSVVSVLCRMAFEFGLWSGGAVPILIVCEEAHRYAPADKGLGFGPTRKAVSRIAKEGRKYNVHLGLITQRPAELDPTIVSQCSTLFAMRMANEGDQQIVRSAVSDAAAALLAFVPALGTREVFAFGEGVALPTRLRFNKLPPDRLPKSTMGESLSTDGKIDWDTVAATIERWRGATMARTRSNAPADKPEDVDVAGTPARTEAEAAPDRSVAGSRVNQAPTRGGLGFGRLRA